MKNIIFSAGHNPEKQGASWNGVTENQVALKWVQRMMNTILEVISETGGANLYGIGTGGLTQKVRAVNMIVDADDGIPAKDNLAIELHFNAAGTTYVEGCETLYAPGSVTGARYAKLIHEAFMARSGEAVGRDRGIKEGWYKMDRPGIIDFYGDVDGDEMPDYWLRATKCPALILEPMFMCQVWNMPESEQFAIADDMAMAILEALNIVGKQ